MSEMIYKGPDSFKGSQWFRWEPHIHTPGTVMNDQYEGENALEDFLKAIEDSNPVIRALGITDYYSLETYETILSYKKDDRLKNVDFIFPNIELRFNTGVASGSAINGHLLISPNDSDHVSQAKRFLTNLTFSVDTETYRCNKEDIIKLGYFHDKSITDDNIALAVGTNQFKVEPKQLLESIKNSEWAKKNILIAAAVGSNDGTSGLQSDSSFSALRRTIERSAHIIFSGQPKQREFWLGKGVDAVEKIISEFKSLKPCIHGSDAHSQAKIGKPDLNRYTWIKGNLSFDSLIQICIEPEDRVVVGELPPESAVPSNIISSIKIENADWLKPTTIKLNPGLVAIIGARGSGKTALADLLASGGYAASSQINSKTSFLRRAERYLTEVVSSVHWQTGEVSRRQILNQEDEENFVSPKVQYLSQQFVDALCSSEGITDELMAEIERVIFSSHSATQRLGIDSFQELLSIESENARRKREDFEQQIMEISKHLTLERNKRATLPVLQKKVEEKNIIIATDKKSREALIAKGTDQKITTLQQVSSSLAAISLKIEQLKKKQRALIGLQQETSSARNSAFPNYWNKLKTSHSNVLINSSQWDNFKINYVGNVDTLVKNELGALNPSISELIGTEPQAIDYKTSASFLPTNKAMEAHTYKQLFHEAERLKYLIGLDNEKGRQYTKLSDKISRDEAELQRLNRDVINAQNADSKINELIEARQSAYEGIFSAIIEEEAILTSLYQPLKENLRQQSGSITKLTFQVERKIDLEKWAEEGDALLDLRKIGPFKGKGSLLEAANVDLKKAWEAGSAKEIADALATFRQKHDKSIINHAPVEKKDAVEFNDWGNKISEWLYSTRHISLSYSVQYDGLDISRLSPGTRGIVLLLLYLVIDKEDTRPLIIDQPEENLDPKSIYHELVPLFRVVKLRRQIIIVTHNANLVVNTDADQIIIAECGPHRPGHLPEIIYKAGGLENEDIREQVCAILEGGKTAFYERAKRLQLHFEM